MSFVALSIIQPWPWLILRPDLVDAAQRAAAWQAQRMKDCENREWEHPQRGWVLLHASSTRLAKWDYQAAAMFAAKRGAEVPMRDNLPYGAMVGAIRIDACVWGHRSPWYVGPRAFVLGAAVPFAEPVECKGAPKFFPVPQPGAGVGGLELAQLITAQLLRAGIAERFGIQPAEHLSSQ